MQIICKHFQLNDYNSQLSAESKGVRALIISERNKTEKRVNQKIDFEAAWWRITARAPQLLLKNSLMIGVH